MKDLTPDQEALAKKIAEYDLLFVSAWNDLLEDFESGVIYPKNEWELRSFLFAKCLSLMSQKKFNTPYQISVEDYEIYEGERADLTLGNLEEMDTRCITVEIKHFPTPDEILSDIEKLRKYLTKDRLAFAYFVALGDISLKEKVDPETLGVSRGQIKWRRVKSPHSERTKLFLVVKVR